MHVSDIDIFRRLYSASESDSASLYKKADASGLQSLSQALQRNAASIVNAFYGNLLHLVRSKTILESLSGAQIGHLKSQQIQNLFALASPDLNAEDHRSMAMQVGRIHAIIGLDRGDLIRSRAILTNAIDHRLDTVLHGPALSLLERRLTRDLVYQSEAYQMLQDARQEVVLRLTRLAWEIDSYTDFIGTVVDILGAHDEIVACSIGRPDEHGVFRFEAASGKTIHYFTELESLMDRHIIANQAWRTGKVQRIINFETDPQALPWRDFALRTGFGSCIAIPLSLPGQSPIAILSLYSAFPGGYASKEQAAFTELLQSILGFAVAHLEYCEGKTHAVAFSERQHWRKLIGTDAVQMHYQAMFDLHTGQICKVEALARLQDGERWLTPADFLSILTPDDFLALYIQGLGQALQQRNIWAKQGLHWCVSINLPSSALRDARYLRATQRALQEHACAPELLMLEILETEALLVDQDLLQELAKFKALGVMLAEDDLGSGHSSLNRLRELPFDCIKIDRNLVNLVDQDPSNVLRFIYQLTRLGHSLGKQVVVEGVEDVSLLEAISILGVDIAQGYAVALPKSAAQMMSWISHGLPLPVYQGMSGVLGRLSRLLIWEERLYLLSRNPHTPVRISDTNPQCAPVGDVPESREMRRHLAFLSEQEAEPLLPAHLLQALIEAALSHGPRSAAYARARADMVAAITLPGHVASADQSVLSSNRK